MNDFISSTNWDNLFNSVDNVNTACELFNSHLNQYVDKCIPTKIVTIRPNDKPWYDSNLRRESRKRDRLRQKARKSKNEKDIVKYKKQRNKFNKMKYHAKEQFFENIDDMLLNILLETFTPNCKKFWNIKYNSVTKT